MEAMSARPGTSAVPARHDGGAAPSPPIARFRLVDGHVVADELQMTGRTRNDTRPMCRGAATAGETSGCSRCRLSLTRVLASLLRVHGERATVAIEELVVAGIVVRAFWPSLLVDATWVEEEPDEPGHTWVALGLPASTMTHVSLRRAAVRDPITGRWLVGEDPDPRATACMRVGQPATDLQRHPDRLCSACASARDRMSQRLTSVSAGEDQADRAAPLHLRAGDELPETGMAGSAMVVATIAPLENGHAHVEQALRADANLHRAWPVSRVGAIRTTGETLCHQPAGDEPRQTTPQGGCTRCALAIGRFARTLQAQWPRTTAWIDVRDAGPVPASLLGGRRVRFGDPALLGSIRRRGHDEPGVDRIVPGTGQTAGHLVWAGRAEGSAAEGRWTATAATPRPLCSVDASGSPLDVQAVRDGDTCRRCVSVAVDRKARRGRFAPDPSGEVSIAGTVYDLGMADLLGSDFLAEMVLADIADG